MEHIIQKDLAERLGLDVRQVRRLEDAGMPMRTRKGRKDYPWPGALRWYIGWKIDSGVARRTPGSLAELELRELQAKVRLAEIKVAEAEGKVVPVDVMQRQMEAIHHATAGAIRSLPQYAGEVVELASMAVARLRLERVANELLLRARGEDEEPEEAEA